METHRCPFCEHDNLTDAKYCSNCGGCLYLVPCPSCGAISDIKAGTCYQCHKPLHGGASDSLSVEVAPVAVISQTRGPDIMSRALETGKLELAHPAPTAGEPTVAPARRGHTVFAGAVAAAAVVAGLGYYAYRHYGVIGAPAPTAAGGVVGTPGTAANSGSIRQPAVAAGAASAPVAASAAACTGEATTLGLCSPQNGAKKELEPAAAGATASPDAAVPPQSQACAPAAAALGLCTPAANATATVPTVTHTRRSE